MTTSEYIERLENFVDDIKLIGIKSLDLKVLKHDKKEQAILIGDKQKAISIWIDYHYDKYNDLQWEYNKYIFDLNNSKDLLEAIIQNQYYDEIDDLIYYYLYE